MIPSENGVRGCATLLCRSCGWAARAQARAAQMPQARAAQLPPRTGAHRRPRCVLYTEGMAGCLPQPVSCLHSCRRRTPGRVPRQAVVAQGRMRLRRCTSRARAHGRVYVCVWGSTEMFCGTSGAGGGSDARSDDPGRPAPAAHRPADGVAQRAAQRAVADARGSEAHVRDGMGGDGCGGVEWGGVGWGVPWAPEP